MRVRQLTTAALVIAAAAAACHPPTDPEVSPLTAAAASVAQVAGAVAGQDAELADEVSGGKHLGFDTYRYPGDATMRTWKETNGAKYKWVGYYLPDAPCHKSDSWAGKRETLRQMGWGLAVVYVGQQTWGRAPRARTPAQLEALRKRVRCNADLVNAAQGVIDADDAIAKAKAEGFPRGTVVFLDLERMERMPPAMRDYYRAWTRRLLEERTYRPGFYAHQHNAEAIYADVKSIFVSSGIAEDPRMWIAGGKDFEEGRAPQDVGYAFAGMWQGLIDVARSVGDLSLPVDVNVSSWASPSED